MPDSNVVALRNDIPIRRSSSMAEARETLTDLPTDRATLARKTMELIETCRASQGSRSAWYRQIHQIVETGTENEQMSLANLLAAHIDRLASHLYSPTDLRFKISFVNEYEQEILKRGTTAAKALMADFSHRDADVVFGRGVHDAVKYGCAILKQWPTRRTTGEAPVYDTSLVMPWQFGVYREDQLDLAKQPAMVETFALTMPELWRTIAHLPNAKEVYRTVKMRAEKGAVADSFSPYAHQVLSTGQLNTGISGSQPTPGGLIQTSGAGGYGSVSTVIDAPLVFMHELWVWDRDDFVTVQIIEPDIIIEPVMRLQNLLIPGIKGEGIQPYSKIQANETTGYFWGETEIKNLVKPQTLLSQTLADIQRLSGLQVDKILGFSGWEGITDEAYGQQREAGYVNVPLGATISDLTPKFPTELMGVVEMLMKMINTISGFDNLLSGQGEPGVRAGNHADTLMKTASPRLRDRALLIERQLTEAVQLRFELMLAKDARRYWTNGEKPEQTSFILANLPEDAYVTVDSHSGSPIFMDDHKELVAFGLKAGIVDKESAIEMLNFPDKDLLIRRLKAKEEQEQKIVQMLIQRDPSAAERLLAGKRSHHG